MHVSLQITFVLALWLQHRPQRYVLAEPGEELLCDKSRIVVNRKDADATAAVEGRIESSV